MVLIASLSYMDVANVMVLKEHTATLAAYALIGAVLTILCGFVLCWRACQTHERPHFGKMASGYVVVAALCGPIGCAAVLGGLPRASLMIS